MIRTVVIEETCVASVGNYSVAASNIYPRDLPDGRGLVKSQLSATVVVWRGGRDPVARHVVVPGSVIALGRTRWRVVRVEGEDHTRGKVALRRMWRVGRDVRPPQM